MSGRPCNPSSDLRQLWQTLLGNTPFPQCGVPDQPDNSQESGDPADDDRPSERAPALQRNR